MIFFFFIDGIGFGEDNIEINPFALFAKSFFLPLANKIYTSKGIYIRTDACLNTPGLPQSATGQTALWTGINAAEILNRHISGFPTSTLKSIIKKHSIIKILTENGFKADFINCYRPTYLEKIKKNKKFPVSTSTHLQLASGRELKTVYDLLKKRSLYMDISNELLNPYIKPSLHLEYESYYQKGNDIFKNLKDYDFCLFEYFLTDMIGHERNWQKAKDIITNLLEEFIKGLIDGLNPNIDQLIISSDHGNFEDFSTKTHTRNDVPTFLYGRYTEQMKHFIFSITDITKAIYKVFDIN